MPYCKKTTETTETLWRWPHEENPSPIPMSCGQLVWLLFVIFQCCLGFLHGDIPKESLKIVRSVFFCCFNVVAFPEFCCFLCFHVLGVSLWGHAQGVSTYVFFVVPRFLGFLLGDFPKELSQGIHFTQVCHVLSLGCVFSNGISKVWMLDLRVSSQHKSESVNVLF